MITDYDGKRLSPKEAARRCMLALGEQIQGADEHDWADAACITRPDGDDLKRVRNWMERGTLRVTFTRRRAHRTHNPP